MSRKKRRGRLIWTDNPPRALSPHQERRGVEFALLLEVCEILGWAWYEQLDPEDDEKASINIPLAATRWLCSLDLPGTEAGVLRGPPLLSRRRVKRAGGR